MVFRLSFDEAAIQSISEKLPGHPIYAGPDGGLFTPGVVEILGEEGISDRWQPGNNHTRQLVLGAEACRDVLFYENQFLDLKTQRRAMNRMAVPICSLIDIVVQLLAVTNNEQCRRIRESSWPRGDRDTYQTVAKRLRKRKNHDLLRRVRNKLAAHLDTNVFTEKKLRLKPEDVLAPLGDCVILLMLSINYPSECFCWIRPVGILEDREHVVVETMYSYPLCVRWIADLKGQVKEFVSMMIAADPRHELQEPITKTVASYNSMVRAVNSELSPIYTVPTKDLLKDGQGTLTTSSSDGSGDGAGDKLIICGDLDVEKPRQTQGSQQSLPTTSLDADG